MRTAVVAPALAALALAASASANTVPNMRVAPENRTFTSTAVDAKIAALVPRFADPNLATLWANCWPNTLDTTVYSHNDTDSFVITGDIMALWLRDSTNQVLSYQAFFGQDQHLARMVANLVRRQAHSLLIDIYANAYNFNGSGLPSWTQQHQDDERTPAMTPPVFEGKYELDSLAAFFKLSFAVWNATDGALTDCFDEQWAAAVDAALDVIEAQQQGTADEGFSPPYSFERQTYTAIDTQMQSGRGPPAKACGLSKCAFRPSDDAVTLPFLVPANAMAVVELRHLATLAAALGMDTRSARAAGLAAELDAGLQTHGRLPRSGASGEVWAYEVDGFGSQVFLDDANVPSLLSLPYLGYVDARDAAYQATRRAVLSDRNPFFFQSANSSQGVPFAGVGSPHTGYGQIWPMSVIMRGLTSTDDAEIVEVLDQLVAASTDTGFMHESFNATNASSYRRPWFAWANGLFGELVLKIMDERPYLILKDAM